jgi:uncharacterized protein YqeY
VSTLKDRIQDDVKGAMRAQDKRRLGALRLITAAIKQREVDERVTLDDTQVVAVLDKMIKQRRESIAQYSQAQRQDLVDQETYELEIIQSYLPARLSDEEIGRTVTEAITTTGASGLKDIGKVMAVLKPRLQGQADMAAVSTLVRQKLGG